MDFLDNRLDVSTGTLRSRRGDREPRSLLTSRPVRPAAADWESSPYEALLLPDTAVATDQSRKIVFVVKADDTVEARAVLRSARSMTDCASSARASKPDDRVIVDGLQRARVGAKVSPHEAKPSDNKPAPAGNKP